MLIDAFEAFVYLLVVVICYTGLAGLKIDANCASLLNYVASDAHSIFWKVLILAKSTNFRRLVTSITVIAVIMTAGTLPLC